MLRTITTFLATTLIPVPRATSSPSRTSWISSAWSSTRVTQSKTKLEYRDLRPCFGTKTRPTRDACLVNLLQKCLYMFQKHFDFLYMSIIMFIVTHVCFGNSQKRIPKVVFRLPRELTNLDLTTLTLVASSCFRCMSDNAYPSPSFDFNCCNFLHHASQAKTIPQP